MGRQGIRSAVSERRTDEEFLGNCAIAQNSIRLGFVLLTPLVVALLNVLWSADTLLRDLYLFSVMYQSSSFSSSEDDHEDEEEEGTRR